MRISDWSSDVCSSDLHRGSTHQGAQAMKFMLTIYHEEKTLDTLPDGEMQSLVDGALDYMEELRQSGHFIVSNALQRGRTARTIRELGRASCRERVCQDV